MNSLFVCALCIAFVSAYSVGRLVLADTDGPNGRITRGQKAVARQFPYQVGLSLKMNSTNTYWCGGSLISPEWVLTAAHCCDGIPEITVFLGGIERFSPTVKYNVTKTAVIIHENYNSTTTRNDIALIRIPHTAFTDRVNRVRLPSLSGVQSLYTGERAIASGWGVTSDNSDLLSNDLMYTTLTVITNAVCAVSYGTAITPSNICVGTPNLSAICEGDSGGPLVLESSKILIGVTSVGAVEGCELGLPDVFTRVSSYLGWIKQHTGVEY